MLEISARTGQLLALSESRPSSEETHIPEPPPIRATSSNSFAIHSKNKKKHVTSNQLCHSKRSRHTFVWELRDRSLDTQLVTRFHLMDILRRIPAVVFLDQESEYAWFVGHRDWGVWPDDGFAFVVFECAWVIVWEVFWRTDDEAGSDGEEGGFVVREFEDEARSIKKDKQLSTMLRGKG